MKKGFTLVEILVVIAVLSVVGVIITTIFIRNLRGSNKAQIISSIKQNGQIVLENMDKTVRNADNLVCISSNADNTVYTMIVEKSGLYIRYRIAPLQNSTMPDICLVNGCIAYDNPTKQTDPATVKEETGPVFIDRVCVVNALMKQATVLTDTNAQTGVQVKSGSFTEPDKKAGFKRIVKINLVLGPGVQAPPAVAGQIDPVTFETTVQLR
mgnify:CR=1 FL=1